MNNILIYSIIKGFLLIIKLSFGLINNSGYNLNKILCTSFFLFNSVVYDTFFNSLYTFIAKLSALISVLILEGIQIGTF